MRSRKQFLSFFLLLVLALPVTGNTDVPRFDGKSRNVVSELPPVAGTQTELLDLQKKPVLVTFFASWCPPCRDEFSHLNRLQQLFDNTDLRIIAINVYEAWDDNDAIRMDNFIASTQPRFPTLRGSEQIRELFGGIDRIPTVYGFNRQGDLAYRFVHKRNAKKTNAEFDELNRAAKLLLQSQ